MFGCNNVHSLLFISYVISNEKKILFQTYQLSFKSLCITLSCSDIIKYYIHNFGVLPMTLLKELQRIQFYVS